MASLASTAAAGYPGQGEIHQRWPQWGLDAAIRSLFPIEWTRGVQIPVLDDLVNSAPFTTFPEFLESRDLDADGPLGPTLMTNYSRGQRRLAEGDQRGSFFAADAVAQIVPLGLRNGRWPLLSCYGLRTHGEVSHERRSRSGSGFAVCGSVDGR